MKLVVSRFVQTQPWKKVCIVQTGRTLNASVTLTPRSITVPSISSVVELVRPNENIDAEDVGKSADMLFFKCCTICEGDLLLEAYEDKANLKCLHCGNASSVPSNTHLFEVLCEEKSYHQTSFEAEVEGFSAQQAA